jgi:hypothetical protein
VQLTPACVTVNVMPAILSVPVREDALVLAAALNPTEPGPLPDDPEVIVSQLALLTEVHAHPGSAVTATEPVEAPAATAVVNGAIAGAQGS